MVLNAEIEHTEGLGTLEGIADEEAALAAPKAVVTRGDGLPHCPILSAGVRAIFFGTERADVRMAALQPPMGSRMGRFRPAVIAPGAPSS